MRKCKIIKQWRKVPKVPKVYSLELLIKQTTSWKTVQKRRKDAKKKHKEFTQIRNTRELFEI